MKLFRYVLLIGCLTACSFAQKESLLIGPGDELHIQVFDTPSLDETVRVTDEGNIPLLLGGSIHVASMTPSQAAGAVEGALIQGKVMYHPEVLVTITGYATQSVTVFGQVLRPGAYAIDTPRSVIDVLALAGGLTDLASRHVIVERHVTMEQIPFDVSNNANEVLDQRVQVYPGDRVIVPKAGIVYVLGDVGRPGGFPMTNNNSEMTALQAVALAGATTPSAVPSHAKLIRRTPGGGFSEIALPLSAMQKGKKPDMALQANDIIYVPFSYLRNAALGLTGIAASAATAIIYTR